MFARLHYFLTRTHVIRRHQSVLDAALYMAMINQVEGDFIEFGVYRGDRMIQAFRTSESIVRSVESRRDPVLRNASAANLKRMRFIGFDSFEGLPSPKDNDIAVGQEAWLGRGEFAASLPEVTGRLRKKCDESRMLLVEGWFEQTLNSQTKKELNLQRAAIVHIDCDFYESTVPALEFITDLLVDGSILIFDDWFLFRGRSDRGERKAFYEWQERHKMKLSPFIPGTAMSFIVER